MSDYSRTTTLEVLAAQISDNAKTVSKYCTQNGYPHPTNSYNYFSPADDVKLLPADAPDSVKQARKILLETAYEILHVCSGPDEYLEQHQIKYQQLSCLDWILQFDILRHVPLRGAIPFADIAASANVPLIRLKSVARMAITGGLLCEPKENYLAHSRISAQFVMEPAYLDWAVFATKYWAPSASKLAEATKVWGQTEERDETAYNLALETKLTMFEHMGRSKEAAGMFARFMRSQAMSEGLALKHLINSFDWASLGKVHIVDVGGSNGEVSTLLASYYPQLQFTVQDLPEVIAESDSIVSRLEPSIAARIRFKTHDFFTPQPMEIAVSADIYFLRKVIHNWNFAHAKEILQNLAMSMKPGAMILIVDCILPSPGSVPSMEEAKLRVRDLTMAENFNSKERELDEWVQLVGSTKPKLRLKESKQSSGSFMAVMVLVLDEDLRVK